MQAKKDTSLVLPSSIEIDGSNYAVVAEAVMSEKSGNGQKRVLRDGGLSMSKLRGIYGLITNVYTRANTPDDFNDSISDLQYIKVKMAYESGREKNVYNFIARTGLMFMLDQIKTYEQFVLYCRYAESLVAYFKFYGGKE